MTDREKVIDWLEKEIKSNDYWDGDYIDYIPVSVLKNILAMLKAQEPVEPIYVMICNNRIPVCENCKGYLNALYHYCPMCGRAVKWE